MPRAPGQAPTSRWRAYTILKRAAPEPGLHGWDHTAGEDGPWLDLLPPSPHPSGPALLEVPVPEQLQNFLRLCLFIPDWTTPWEPCPWLR